MAKADGVSLAYIPSAHRMKPGSFVDATDAPVAITLRNHPPCATMYLLCA
jgi:hypothetical protein